MRIPRLLRQGGTRSPRPGVRVLLLRLVLAALLATILPLLAMRWVPPLTTSFMVQRFVSSVFQGEPGVRYRWVAWRNIPRPMRLAVVAAEDQKFPDHWGFDFQSIADAAERNNRRRVPRGASTITQQVAKNLFLWPGRSWLRKGIEAYLTVWIELLWPKRRILEVYLNIAEFGDRTYGVGAASEHLMRKPPRRLTTRDASLLAAVLPNPRRFRADRPSPYVERRAAWIQKQMRRLGSAYLDDL